MCQFFPTAGAASHRMRFIGRFVATSLWLSYAAVSPAAKEAPPLAFTPNGNWELIGDDGRCTLHRDFVNGSEKLHFSIEVLPLDQTLELSLRTSARDKASKTKNRQIDFMDNQRPVTVPWDAFGTTDGQSHIDRFDLSKEQFNRALVTRVIVVDLKPQPVRLDLPNLDAAVRYLGDCERALVESVGLPSEEVKAIVQPAKKPPLLTRYGPEYFDLAEKGDPEDIAVSRSIVSVDGKVVQCGLVHRAASESLNRQACHDWGPLVIVPARDKDGTAVRGIIFERRRWLRREP